MRQDLHGSGWKSALWAVLLTVTITPLIGCGDETPHSPCNQPGAACSTHDAASDWGACPDYPEFSGAGAECRFLDVPLNYDHPDATIPIFVARVRGGAPESAKRGQLWFLTGGPGSSVIGFVRQAKLLAATFPEWDYYAFEQRGVGNSSPLLCTGLDGAVVVPPDQVATCLAELSREHPEGIGDYTVSNTARDLAWTIDRLREPEKKVVVYGVSYGTYLLQRYLALFPAQVDAAVLDSIAPVGLAEYDTFERDVNDAAHGVMGRCAQDDGCRQRLAAVAPDPWTAMGLTLERLDRGELCPALQMRLESPLARSDLQHVFGTMSERTDLRGLMPATVLRLNRCQPQDVDALETLVDSLLSPAAATSGAAATPAFVPHDQVKQSVPLFTHIVLSEMFKGTPASVLEKQVAHYNASLPQAVPLAQLNDAHLWPVYRDPLSTLHAHTDIPVLMLNSDLDPQTPIADALHLRDDLHGAHQYFVTVPDAGHVVILNSLLRDTSGDQPTDNCGTRVLFSFLDDPTRPPDTSCLSELQRLSFDAADPRNQKSSQKNFGTVDLWGEASP